MISNGRGRSVRFLSSLVKPLALAAAASLSVLIAPAAAHAGTSPSTQLIAHHNGGNAGGPARGQRNLAESAAAGATNGSLTSHVWDGYFVSNSGLTNTTTFTAVSATWVQPAVRCNAAGSEGSFWVGLDGWANTSVEQGGSDAECLNTMTPTYYLWWEMFPFNDSVDVVQINAGDTIHGSVTFDPTTSLFNIVITDETLNKGLTESIACQADMGGCNRSSAEVISENSSGGGNTDGTFLLPNYGTMSYSSASVTDVNGHTGTLNDSAWTLNNVTNVSSESITKQTVGTLSADGSSFSTTWQQYSGDGTTVQIDYAALATAATTSELDIELEVVNTGTNPVNLVSIHPEYWFSDEDTSSQLVTACDYAAVGCANVTPALFSAVVAPSPTNAKVMLEFGSSAGVLAPGANSGPIEFRVYHQDFSAMTQTNDYSFNAADTTLTPNPLADAVVVGAGLNWGVSATPST